MDNNIELNYETVFQNGEANIKTPFNIEFKDIKQIFIQQTDSLTQRLSIYPNGFVVFFEQTSTTIIVKSNWPVEEIEPNKYIVKEPHN